MDAPRASVASHVHIDAHAISVPTRELACSMGGLHLIASHTSAQAREPLAIRKTALHHNAYSEVELSFQVYCPVRTSESAGPYRHHGASTRLALRSFPGKLMPTTLSPVAHTAPTATDSEVRPTTGSISEPSYRPFSTTEPSDSQPF